MSISAVAPWTWLVLIVLLLFVASKWLTCRSAARCLGDVPLRRRLCYWLLWPGMDAPAFLGPRLARRPAGREWLAAAGKTFGGALLVGWVARCIPTEDWFWRDWAVLVGLGLLGPFGVLHLVALAWCAAGVEARPIMDRPFVAISLTEFWGRRWNLASRDVAHDFVFRPLVRRVGVGTAVAATFLFSGLTHELALSVPAMGGFGWPTTYFLLQLAGVRAERSGLGTCVGCAGWRGRLFCWVVTVSPAYAVFHRPLMDRVVFPALGSMGLL